MDDQEKTKEELQKELLELQKAYDELKLSIDNDDVVTDLNSPAGFNQSESLFHFPLSSGLRSKAEKLLITFTPHNNPESSPQRKITEADIIKYIHELQVYQIELEMQTQELILAQEQIAKDATDKYAELYDSAPSGYFTLSNTGAILELNLSGATMLGKDRYQLENSQFGSFVSDESKPIFNAFLKEVFAIKKEETCELILSANGKESISVYLAGVVTNKQEQCLVTMIDISVIKQAAQELFNANKELALQQDHLKKIASRVPGFIYQYLLRPDGTSCFPYASEGIREIYRVSPDEVREDASKVFSVGHIDDFAGAIASIQESAQNLTPWQHEYRVKFDDGIILSLYGNAVPQLESDGSVLWHGFITDVTEKNKLKARLKSSEEQRLSILEDVQDVVWSLSWPDLKVNFISKSVEQVFGRKVQEFIDNALLWADTVHPDDKHVSVKALEQLTKTGAAVRECRIIKPDGSIVWINDKSKIIFNQDGLPIRIDGVSRDITEHKQAEVEISSQAGMITSLLDSIPDLIFFKDLDGVYLGCNQPCAEFIGRSKEEIIGKTDYDFFDKEIADIFRKNNQSMLEAFKSRQNEDWLTYPDGRKILVNTLITPFMGSDGKTIGVLGISRDITELKHMEEEIKLKKR